MKYAVIQKIDSDKETFLETTSLDEAKKKAFKLVQAEVAERKNAIRREAKGFDVIKFGHVIEIQVVGEDGKVFYSTKLTKN